MISITIFSVFLVAAIFIAFSTRDKMSTTEKDRWGDDHDKFNFSWLFKPLAIFILGIIISAFQPFAIEKLMRAIKD